MPRLRWIALAVVLVAVAAAGGYFGSCAYSLKKLGDSARAGDGQGVLDRTDLPRLRQSLTVQLLSAYERRQGANKRPNVLQQLLKNVAPNIADALIARVLTAERLSELLRTGKTEVGSGAAPIEMPALADVRISDALSRVRFINPVSLSFRTNKTAGEDYFIVMHFENFTWKMAEIRLPESTLDRIVKGLR